MLADQASQFKHGDLGFAKHLLELVVSIDVALVLGVLETILLDVVPDFLGDGAAGLCSAANDCSQNGVRLHGFHEGGISFALSDFFGHRQAC